MKKTTNHLRMSAAVVLWLCGAMTQSSNATVVGNVASFASDPSTNSVLFTCQGTQKVKLSFCKPDVVKVEFDPGGMFTHAPWAGTYPADENDALASAPWNLKAWPAVSFTVTDDGAQVRLQTSKLTVRVTKSPFLISYYDAGNTNLIAGDAAPMESQELKLTMSRTSTEHFFGYPDEQQYVMDWKYVAPLDKTGYLVPGRSPIMYSTRGYGVLVVTEGPWNVPRADITVAGKITYNSQ